MTLGTLVWFVFCCIIPCILLVILFSTLWCQKPWKTFTSNPLPSSGNDDEMEDEFHDPSEDLSAIVATEGRKTQLGRDLDPIPL